jgi:hypothetical protein
MLIAYPHNEGNSTAAAVTENSLTPFIFFYFARPPPSRNCFITATRIEWELQVGSSSTRRQVEMRALR